MEDRQECIKEDGEKCNMETGRMYEEVAHWSRSRTSVPAFKLTKLRSGHI